MGITDVLKILIIGNIFQILYYTVGNYILFIGKTGKLSAITIIIWSIYVVAGWFITGLFGIKGLSVLFAIMNVLYFCSVWWLSAKINPKPWFDMFQLKREAKVFINRIL